ARAQRDGHRLGAGGILHAEQLARGRGDGVLERRGGEGSSATNLHVIGARIMETIVAAKATLVADELLGILVDGELRMALPRRRRRAIELSVAGPRGDLAAGRATIAGGLRLLEFPRTRLEAVGLAGEATDRAQVDHIAGEDVGDGPLAKRADVVPVATIEHTHQVLAADFIAEAHTTRAHDATVALDVDEGVGLRLDELALLVDHARV